MKKGAVIIGLLNIYPLYSRVYEPSNRHSFWKQVNKSYMAVVQLYCADRSAQGKADAQFLKDRFNALSSNNRFSYVGLDFISFNTTRYPRIVKELSLSQLPAVILCINGVPLKESLVGYVKEPDIATFIERHLSKRMDTVADKKEKYDAKVQDAKLSAYANCCWGYPCWTWYGPGCGWGGGCGFGWAGGFGCRSWCW